MLTQFLVILNIGVRGEIKEKTSKSQSIFSIGSDDSVSGDICVSSVCPRWPAMVPWWLIISQADSYIIFQSPCDPRMASSLLISAHWLLSQLFCHLHEPLQFKFAEWIQDLCERRSRLLCWAPNHVHHSQTLQQLLGASLDQPHAERFMLYVMSCHVYYILSHLTVRKWWRIFIMQNGFCH